MKDKGTVYMCMSCGNCKRKDGENGCSFTFTCGCGDFIVDSAFASKIEFIGCRSWIPADDNYWEPYIFMIDEKHKTIKVGKSGKTFENVDPDKFRMIGDAYDYESEDEFNQIIEFCKLENDE